MADGSLAGRLDERGHPAPQQSSLTATSARSSAFSAPQLTATPLTSTQWGMLSFLLSEVAFFSTLIVTYLTYMGKDQVGPTPAVLSLPLVIGTTICLLSSSVTVHLAERSLRSGSLGRFALFWSVTILLGAAFILGTAYEWQELIVRHHLTINTNLFGTTYYTLVGFHALHLTVGLIVLSIVLVLTLRREIAPRHSTAVELTSWYWHFVDGVWVVVFTVVYLVGR
jgi:cytochrome c oxidase subunit 3/cytochrome o ubiquinol oxidase subunit 3